MAKSPTFGPNNGFVFWPTPSEKRRGTIQLGQLLVGPTYTPPSFSFRFVKDGDLSFYVAERVATTARKMMFATAQLYAEGPHAIPISVRGAHLQDLEGHSSTVRAPDGKVYYLGIQGAHFGMGTVTRCEEALSESAARQVRIWRSQSGVSEGDVQAFPNNAQLAAYGLAHDSATYWEPTFMNQSAGRLETKLQPELSKILPLQAPANAAALELQTRRVGQDTIAVCVGPASPLVRIINDRRARLSKGSVKEARQSPNDPAENRPFEGSEVQFLERMLDLIGSSGFEDKVEAVSRQIEQSAHDVVKVAEGSRQERAEAKASEGSSSGS